MNFIIKLLELTNSTTNVNYDSIFVIINHFIKYSHIVSFKKIFTTKQLNFIVFDRFIKYHEILKNVINDKNKFFTFHYLCT